MLDGLRLWRETGVKMGVFTNKPAIFTEVLLERMDIADFFDVVVSGDTTEFKKPHPEPMRHACRWMGVEPAKNLHIGDSLNDVQAARAAGCAAYCVPYGYSEGVPVTAADCDALVPDLLAAFQVAKGR